MELRFMNLKLFKVLLLEKLAHSKSFFCQLTNENRLASSNSFAKMSVGSLSGKKNTPSPATRIFREFFGTVRTSEQMISIYPLFKL